MRDRLLGGGECLHPTHTATTVWLQSGPFPDTMELLNWARLHQADHGLGDFLRGRRRGFSLAPSMVSGLPTWWSLAW